MAEKTIYRPRCDEIGVIPTLIHYEYFSGFSLSRKQKCIESLHNSAKKMGINNILEVSSKSKEKIGVQLSSFNLILDVDEKHYTVEQLFQSGKIFEAGGPFPDLLNKTSREARNDERLKTSGNLLGFTFFGESFPLEPKTFFYDWLYINALLNNKHLISQLQNYDGFSDIEFNEKKSLNCQAYSLALFSSILSNEPDILTLNSISKSDFLSLCAKEYKTRVFSIKPQIRNDENEMFAKTINRACERISNIAKDISKIIASEKILNSEFDQKNLFKILHYIENAKFGLEELVNSQRRSYEG